MAALYQPWDSDPRRLGYPATAQSLHLCVSVL